MHLVTFRNNIPSISHKVIAEHTGNQYKNISELITKHKEDFEEFGRVAFETETLQTNGGMQKTKTYFLNEPQATLLLTYLKNVPVVRKFKKDLVRAFFLLREQSHPKPQNLEQTILQQNNLLAMMSEKLHRAKDELISSQKETIEAQKVAIESSRMSLGIANAYVSDTKRLSHRPHAPRKASKVYNSERIKMVELYLGGMSTLKIAETTGWGWSTVKRHVLGKRRK